MPKTIYLSRVAYSVSSIVFPGQEESGDLYLVKELPTKLIIGVVDGMGHGREAAVAAKSAIETLESNSDLSVINLARLCHDKLKPTRGAVMALASINYIDETLTWLSIGNVEGMLLHADKESKPTYQSIYMCPGVLGYRLSNLHATIVPVSKGDMLIFSTDGIRSDYVLRIAADADYMSLPSSHPFSTENNEETVEASNETEHQELQKVYHLYGSASNFQKGIMKFSPYKITEYISKRFIKGSDDALILAIKYLGKDEFS